MSETLSLDEADALLCECAPTSSLFQYRGPAAWYVWEPVTNPVIGIKASSGWRTARARLAPWQFLHHAHPDPRYRVPCLTHVSETSTADAQTRKRRVVAIVSSHLGTEWKSPVETRQRAALVTRPEVDLFGSPDVWRSYRRSFWAPRGTPGNFRGPLPGKWGTRHKLLLMAQYHAAACLENTVEPFYFTEKFFGAAVAGCVPIYQPHSTVAEAFLRGARWVDPADFDFDPQRTIEFALAAKREEYADANRAWLSSDAVKRTSFNAVFERICGILRGVAERGS